MNDIWPPMHIFDIGMACDTIRRKNANELARPGAIDCDIMACRLQSSRQFQCDGFSAAETIELTLREEQLHTNPAKGPAALSSLMRAMPSYPLLNPEIPLLFGKLACTIFQSQSRSGEQLADTPGFDSHNSLIDF
ncbi:hypothetical protein [Parasphingopyxis sp.]|uniref:hypothetical protein n=1 Tax=Parasphingopyxis sp. TaxID=1920299 RepID=UPI0026161E7D|nr:hypothetical protein [Parasphingopyxis sp.]